MDHHTHPTPQAASQDDQGHRSSPQGRNQPMGRAAPLRSGAHGHGAHPEGHLPPEKGASSSESGHHGAHTDHTGHEALFRTRFWGSLFLSLPVLAYSPLVQRVFRFTAPTFPGSAWVPFLFSLVVFAYGGIPFLKMALPELRSRRPGMMSLISLAISVALGYSLIAQVTGIGEGFFWELVTLIDVMLLGHWMEMRSIRQASGALEALARLMPDQAERLRPDGSVEVMPAAALQVGDMVLVRPGASIPADGEVVEGSSQVNEAMITGESRPVPKGPGSPVIAGTINGEGSLRVRVTAVGEQTALAGIMRLVDQAQRSKSRTQVLADRAAGWLFYVALGAALVTGVAWGVALGFDVTVVKRVVTVLVIACPHALGLAVPLVVAITTALGARQGILIRDRLALEAAREVEVVIFDKTGTLTEGRFGVVGVALADPQDVEAEALALAAAVEGDSEHPIAQAVRRAAQERGVAQPTVQEFTALKGRGVRAEVEGRTVYVGGPRLLAELGLQPEGALAAFARQAGQQGQTVIYLVDAGRLRAALAVADGIRPESYEAVERLHALGLEVVMITGDSQEVAQAVASALGIARFFAEVLPEHKDRIVAEMQAQGQRVAMVGDGVNDAPALARADVGIAIGGGTDVAIESAGIVLVRSDPRDVVKVIALSRASYRKMVQNLWWAAGYNVIALPLAAGVLAPWGVDLSPAVGALLMSLSTVVVAANAQLLRRAKL